jgi:hypothetical protein
MTAHDAAPVHPERAIVLLGPQRLVPTLRDALRSLGAPDDARVATVTAGWQEREPDDQELDEHLGGRTANLQLYRRAERAFQRDPELASAHHGRQETLRELQALYQLRLGHAMAACLELLQRTGDGWLERARADAIAAVRDLDSRHLALVREVHAEFDTRWRPLEREAIAHERREISELLQDCASVAIAGGHVAVLLNRLRLFDLGGLVDGRTIAAWSAGAMAIGERVVLFHDDPPHGRGDAEMLETGLGWVANVQPFPHAHRRLRLDDRTRVGLMAARLAPAVCVAFDDGGALAVRGERWAPGTGVRRFERDGALSTMGAR